MKCSFEKLLVTVISKLSTNVSKENTKSHQKRTFVKKHVILESEKSQGTQKTQFYNFITLYLILVSYNVILYK